MSSVAAIVLAHNDPVKVGRLLGALRGLDLFLHCDGATPRSLFDSMLEDAPPGVTILPRRRTTVDSWSLVDAELRGLRTALETSEADHIAILSGSCYPLTSVEFLQAELARWRGISRIKVIKLPSPGWDTPRNQDGGLWRFNRRFVTFRDQVVKVRGIPLRTIRRKPPPGLRLCGSSQWKIYDRRHAALLLELLDDNPAQLRFWRKTLVPEESCVASILTSPALVGDVVDQISGESPWYISWPREPVPHPPWLDERDFDDLVASQDVGAERRSEDPALPADTSRRPLFARKIGSQACGLLDAIDLTLRGADATSVARRHSRPS